MSKGQNCSSRTNASFWRSMSANDATPGASADGEAVVWPRSLSTATQRHKHFTERQTNISPSRPHIPGQNTTMASTDTASPIQGTKRPTMSSTTPLERPAQRATRASPRATMTLDRHSHPQMRPRKRRGESCHTRSNTSLPCRPPLDTPSLSCTRSNSPFAPSHLTPTSS